VTSILKRSDVDIFVSVVSIWEIIIKQAVGKLEITAALSQAIKTHEETSGLQILPVMLPHVLSVESLPLHHKDPFDRLLIAQAITEDMTLVSADHVFTSYPVLHLW
jgi:PIN domain nuclease of toxin-antitoxin system